MKASSFSHNKLASLAESQQWTLGQTQQAMQLLGLCADSQTWRKHFDFLLLTLGTALVAIGVAAFVAWNWADLGDGIKFALLQSAFIGCVGFTWLKGIDKLAGQCALNAAAFLVGVQWALFGQVYQTGADPYGLFLAWGVCLLPWAVIGRQAGLWLMITILANLTLILYWTQVLYPPPGWWQLSQVLGPLVWLGTTVLDNRLANCLFLLNATALCLWEWAAYRYTWMQGRTLPRMVLTVQLGVVLIPTLMISVGVGFDHMWKVPMLSPVLYGICVGIILYYYQRKKLDLYMLTVSLVSCILVATTLFGKAFGGSAGGFLTIALALIGQTSGAALWLRGVAKQSGASL